MAQMPGRYAKDQQSEPMAAPPRHIIEPLPHWLDPLEIMMPPEQRLETWIILRADQPDLQLIQNGLFFDLGQTIWLRHPRNLKKLAAGVQSKVSIPLSRAVFHILMSQPCFIVRISHGPGAHNPDNGSGLSCPPNVLCRPQRTRMSALRKRVNCPRPA